MTTIDSAAAGHALAQFIARAAFKQVADHQADPAVLGSSIIAAGIVVLSTCCGREELIGVLVAAAEHAATSEEPRLDA